MVGNVGAQQLVLPDYSGYQFLVDFVLFFPETDPIGDRG